MNEVIELLIQLIEDSMQDIDTMSDEEFDELIQFLLESVEILTEIQEEENLSGGVPPVPPVPPEVEPAQFPSSNVNAYAYNSQTQQMLVQFHGPYPNAEGPIYQYDNVHPNTFNIINRGAVAPRTSGKNRYHAWRRNIAPSHGASVYALLREGGNPYRRIA